jgi:uncharacterized protein
VHTVARVPTSIGAFIGWASQGPTDEAVLVQSWSDFARQYGGLTSGGYLGYAVGFALLYPAEFVVIQIQ